jgi:hypothetical protein
MDEVFRDEKSAQKFFLEAIKDYTTFVPHKDSFLIELKKKDK